MKSFDKKFVIYIILAIILMLVACIILFFCFAFQNKKIENNISIENQMQNNIELKPSHEVDKKLNENILIQPEEKIYGYDENAIEVQDFYNGFKACGYIEIPKTNLSLPVLDGQTVSGMEYSCCMLYTTGEMNLSGNTYIVGHNYENGTLFSNNKQLEIGDKIILTGMQKNRLEYTIYNIFNTDPMDTSYLTKEIDDETIELTLQTCNNDDADTRLIIQASHQIQNKNF